ncbi:hypothetical protein Y032_0012g1733 [Ancylostoma ceylanicum]|uniref:Uncharacterized protein n=1 Tax=Ancylostoma ceylanicum TaxID=53326 RepID=A0A016VCL6_9BILA|nr:hypothetical protein Y032_0012g1733 [Ancylostoma ceylanicum]
MDTPKATDGSFRRKPIKRQCIDPTCSPSGDLDRHAQELLKDVSLPPHLKAIVSFLLEDRRRLNSLMEDFRELNDELSKLRAENERLRISSTGDCSPAPAAPRSDHSSSHAPPLQ